MVIEVHQLTVVDLEDALSPEGTVRMHKHVEAVRDQPAGDCILALALAQEAAQRLLTILDGQIRHRLRHALLRELLNDLGDRRRLRLIPQEHGRRFLVEGLKPGEELLLDPDGHLTLIVDAELIEVGAILTVAA